MVDLVFIDGLSEPAAAPSYHIIDGDPPVLLLVKGSRIFSINQDLIDGLECCSPDAAAEMTSLQSETEMPELTMPPQPSAISLNIAQTCNLSCSYCYADEGRFGGKSVIMTIETARKAIDRLLDTEDTRPASVGFIGGEPLLNRRVLHDSVMYSAGRAAKIGRQISFGITTNGTLVEPEDIALFRAFPFAVTVSLDGSREVNDGLRLSKNHRSSFDAVVERMRPLLEFPGRARMAARATITRQNMDVAAHLFALTKVGFAEVGMSPLRTSPQTDIALSDGDWAAYLEAMKIAGDIEWRRVRLGGSFAFSNLAIALKQLHRGDCRTLPCGSASNYVSVSATGDYFTCHRTIDDAQFFLGDSAVGPSRHARESFIRARQVDTQQPCRSCWARYLCGGGCHAEVLRSGRAGCDYIRGWLEYCISLYPAVLASRPDLLGDAMR
jgi:uncharacterized protein